MKTTKLVYLLLAIITFITISCENEVEFNGDDTTSLLVLNSFITPDSVVKVHVSKSKFFLKDDTNFDFITDAIVHLWVNDVKIEKLTSTGNGFYSAIYKPKVGDKIKITAHTSEFSEVFGSIEVLQPTSIISVDTVIKTLDTTPLLYYKYKEYGQHDIDTVGYTKNQQIDFTLNFKVPVSIKNYYILKITLRNYYSEGGYNDTRYNITLNDLVFGSNDDIGIFESSYNYYQEFSDDLFNGTIYGLKFYSTINTNFYDEDYKPQEGEVGVNSPIRSELLIDLQSISKSYYMYIKTISANSEGDDTNFFREPVQIYTNINGGIGVVGSYSHSIIRKNIPITTNMGYYSKVTN